jgi:hypothetical protein
MIPEVIKLGVELVAGFGGGLVIDNIVKVTTPGAIGVAEKVVIRIGGFFLSGMIGDATATYAGKTIDRIADMVVKAQMKAKAKEVIVEQQEGSKDVEPGQV